MQVNNRTHFFSEFGTHFVIMKYSKNAFIHSNEHNVYFFQKAYNKQRLTKNEVKKNAKKKKNEAKPQTNMAERDACIIWNEYV